MSEIPTSEAFTRTAGAVRRAPERWWTVPDVIQATGCASRTARAHLQLMAGAGLAERLTTQGGFRYRWRPDAPDPLVRKLSELAGAWQA